MVAIIDSGMDMDHPDLISSLWVNKGEIPGNGIDDDGNGERGRTHNLKAVCHPPYEPETPVEQKPNLISCLNSNAGFIDDVYGYDFAGQCNQAGGCGSCSNAGQCCSGKGSPSADSSIDKEAYFHGTHVAGLVAAAQGNLM